MAQSERLITTLGSSWRPAEYQEATGETVDPEWWDGPDEIGM
jgi:hypothetical protein